ncbi:hypothetical protein AB6E39_20080 [Vibrio splendidus]|uniref:hypothetical protein n=1 Tax=Vibrio splendidus TaxID=29497 RepID=UPI001E3B39B0|nr:hypothetical protein [Vibrio splendidus]MCC4790088.1 hypothetical protein [Vibrio splendidus]
MTELYVAAATVGAALVSGFISIVNLTLSKEHKISELRQEWIDMLRGDVASFIAVSNNLVLQYQAELFNNNGTVEYWIFHQKVSDNIKLMDELHHRIKLRLNPTEHFQIITILDDIESSLGKIARLQDMEQMNYLFKVLHDLSQQVFKENWELVKRGESGFWRLKLFSVVLVVLSLIATTSYFSKLA